MSAHRVLVLISFCTISVFGENETSCHVSALKKHFHVHQTKPTETDDIPNGTSLKLNCKSTSQFSWAFCQNGQWTVEDTNCSLENTKALAKPLKRRKRGWFWVIIGVVTLVASIFSCPRPTPRDSTKPLIYNCPYDRTVIALPMQYYAYVTFTPPTAWDNKDGPISVFRSEPYNPSGQFFHHGGIPTKVGYYARDKAGNMATCNFNIYVKVIRCQLRSITIPNGYRNCYPSSGTHLLLGTFCWYGCYQGHTLKGAPSRIKCLETGQWSSPNEPYCEKKQCSKIVPRGLLKVSCTAANNFRSICTFQCDEGFDIPKDQRRTRVCLASGRWTEYDPQCVDVEPPIFEQCPTTLIFYPDDNKDTAFISWDKPVVTDNKDKGLEPTQVSGPSPASEQGVNTYTVIYTVQDLAGNEGKECSFDIVVKQLRCPKLYPLPYMNLNCTGTRRGSECSFSCQYNMELVGNRNTFCQRNEEDAYAKWVMEFYPFCNVSNGCPDIVPPAHGAIACDVWVGGRFCHPFCSLGYSVLYQLPNFLICQSNGIWLHHNEISDCYETYHSGRYHTSMTAEFYFTGNCNDPATQAEIKKTFMTAIERSLNFLVTKHCNTTECNVGNVQVICPENSRKRSTNNMIMNTDISFEFGNGTLTSHQYETEMYTIIELTNSLEADLKSDNFSLVLNGQHTYLLELTSSDIQIDCSDNSLAVYNNIISCVQCQPGTFYDDSSKTCSTCSRGSYQTHFGQNQCIPCPNYQKTARKGATDVLECEDGCRPGTWSWNGIPPCEECDVGYYENNYGSTDCKRCPGNRITLTGRSDNVSNCFDYDLVFSSSTDSYTELKMTGIPLQTPFVVTFHIHCHPACQGTFFRLVSSASENFEMTSNSFILNTHVYQILGNLDFSKKWCHIAIHISRTESSLFADGELQALYKNEVLFADAADVNITLGGKHFMGAISQFNIVPLHVYLNNTHLYSKCGSEGAPVGFTNWNEFAHSNLINAYINIPSKCDDYDDCQMSPCVNGSCTDKLLGYNCACFVGFTGNNCQIDIDDCIAHVCQNNATCIDGVNSYSCSCDYGDTGELCEIAMVDGSWSNWDNWTECSVSCGNGTIQRQRSCSNPLPDNGGHVCEGPDTENDICSLEPCRVCKELIEPSNTSLSCVNNSDTITCVLSCDDGFAFDIDVKEEYVCGNETYYYWDFQTNDNPYGRLPHCTEVVQSSKIHVDHSAYYDFEGCGTLLSSVIKNKITTRIESATQQLTCVTSNICIVSSNKVFNCDNSRRKKDNSTFVGFTVKFTCDILKHGTETCFYGLEDAIKELIDMENGNEFDIPHNSITHTILPNSSSSSSSLNCPLGTIPFIAYCVPCSIGHFCKNEECLSCAKGSYQDQTGQTFCFSCPNGMTTEGTDSVSIGDCNVPTPTSAKESNLSIILGVCISIPILVILVVVTVAFWRQKGHFKSHGKEYKQNKSDTLNINCDRVRKPRLDTKTIKSTHNYDNKSFEFNVCENSTARVSYSFSLENPIEEDEVENISEPPVDVNENGYGRPISPRECWTQESLNDIDIDC